MKLKFKEYREINERLVSQIRNWKLGKDQKIGRWLTRNENSN